MNNIKDHRTTAVEYSKAGLSVLPVELPSKKPCGIGSWKQLQQTIATEDEINLWFVNDSVEIAIVCGKVSGNLEVIDFDEKYNIDAETLLDRFKKIINELSPGLMEKLVIEKTVSGGYHVIYKCDTIGRNQELALRPPTSDEKERSKTLIETRGEGGYFLCAPSNGYEIIQGSLLEIPTISAEERTLLMNCARGFNEVVKKQDVFDRPSHLNPNVKRPGDDFNLRGDIRSILKENGWTRLGKHDRGEYWRRPGKSDGISASILCGKRYSVPFFYVFSSNAHPFEPNKHHSYFAVYTLLKHGGNWAEAAKAIEKEGFGSTTISEAEEYLRARYEFRLNVITSKTEYREIGTNEFVEIKDLQLNSLYRELQRFHIKIGLDVLAGLLHSDFVPVYDPFVEYYKSLPAWDGTTDYIEQLAATVTLAKTEDPVFFKEHLTKWLVNAVGCAINPKSTNHNALILVGPQGRYKTTWLNRLVPPQLEQYRFIGTINPDNKDTLIHLSECYLINLDELETLRKHDLGSLKSIMTLQQIHVRRPYGRIAENLVRRASFVGSINRKEFLSDETGTRRFLTYEIESIDLKAPIDMDSVHSQVYHLFQNGYQYWFDSTGIDTVNKQNERFTIQTTEDELISKMFAPASENACQWLTATDIALRAKVKYEYPVNPNSAKNFGTAMKKAGFTSKRTNKGVNYAVRELTGNDLLDNQAPPTPPVREEQVVG